MAFIQNLVGRNRDLSGEVLVVFCRSALFSSNLLVLGRQKFGRWVGTVESVDEIILFG